MSETLSTVSAYLTRSINHLGLESFSVSLPGEKSVIIANADDDEPVCNLLGELFGSRDLGERYSDDELFEISFSLEHYRRFQGTQCEDKILSLIAKMANQIGRTRVMPAPTLMGE